MNSRNISGVARVLVFGALVLGAFTGCSNGDAPASAGGPGGPGPAPPTPVRVAVAEARSLVQTVDFAGELLAERRVELAPETSGRLVELLVDEGDRVTAEQRLAQLDTELVRRDVAEADARLHGAQARVAQAHAQREQQANEVSRRRPLAERNAFPAAQFAQLEDALQVGDEAVAVAETQVREAEAALQTARAELTRREVVAPFDGLVVTRHATVGAIASAQSPLLTLVDESSLRFVFPLSEQRLSLAAPGATATIRFDAFPDRVLEATIVQLGGVVDRESRTVDVKLRIEAAEAGLRHGMFGRGQLVAVETSDGTVVPITALQTTREDTVRVWTVDGDVVHPVDANVTLRTEAFAAVEGVAAGTRVVLAPPMSLTDGARVVVVGAPSDGSGAAAAGTR